VRTPLETAALFSISFTLGLALENRPRFVLQQRNAIKAGNVARAINADAFFADDRTRVQIGGALVSRLHSHQRHRISSDSFSTTNRDQSRKRCTAMNAGRFSAAISYAQFGGALAPRLHPHQRCRISSDSFFDNKS
jgi:hypothetical protein